MKTLQPNLNQQLRDALRAANIREQRAGRNPDNSKLPATGSIRDVVSVPATHDGHSLHSRTTPARALDSNAEAIKAFSDMYAKGPQPLPFGPKPRDQR